MPKDYGSWTLAELKAELRKRNAKLTGKKAVLVQRLQDYDAVFGGLVNDPEATYCITTPGPELFKDINADSNLPKITEEDLQRYSVLAEKENITSSKNMYDEHFLLTSRCAEAGGFHFITGLCASEMRKNVTYNVTLKLKEHLLSEGQCECAAGMGPYAQCKHVLVLIYAVLDFSLNKTIKTRASCTSTLQTFHHPTKIYHGEPVKAEEINLKLKHGSDLKHFNPLENISDNDDDEKYNENFKNLIINYSAELNKANMAIMHIIKPADKKALYYDHDYLKDNQEDMYLKSLILNEEQRKELEVITRKKSIWKKERVKRLQSSDFGKICKCSDTNKKKLAKTLSVMKDIQTPAIKHGHKYEHIAIKKFQEKTGLEVQKCGIIINTQYQYLGCTPDGLLDQEVLEIKCPYTAANKSINGENIPFLYLCEETGEYKLKKDHDYYYQVQGQLLCTGKNAAYFCVYTIADFCMIKIYRDNDFISDMLNKLKMFYSVYFKDVFLNKYLYNRK